MVVSKRWFELSGGTKFRYPTSFLPQFHLLFTLISPPLNLNFTSFDLNLTSASLWISNHGLETTVYRLVGFPQKPPASKPTSMRAAVSNTKLCTCPAYAHKMLPTNISTQCTKQAMRHLSTGIRWKMRRPVSNKGVGKHQCEHTHTYASQTVHSQFS